MISGGWRLPRLLGLRLQAPLHLGDAYLASDPAAIDRGVAPARLLPTERDRARVLAGVDHEGTAVAAVVAGMLFGCHGQD